MIESIERELKYLVKKSEFYNLKKYLDSSCLLCNTVIQTNYYFDTSNYTLKSKGISLRLREIDHKEYYLTVKVKNAEVINNLHIKKEYCMQINQKDFDLIKGLKDIRILSETLELLKNILEYCQDESALNMIGCLTTKRISYKIPGFDEPILLDKNMYLSRTDYEIEWETEEIDRASQKIKNIFDGLGITAQVNSVSKSSRFIRLQQSNVNNMH